MLIEFRAENHRSIRDEQVLTMEADNSREGDDPRPRTIDGNKESLLPVVAIYGANASGKSNILSALAFMRFAVIYSHRSWAPDEGIPREAFAWGVKKDEPSLFEITFLIDSVRYEYGFVANDNCFIEEWLYAWPNGKKQTWFERDNDTFDFGTHLKGENKLIKDVTRPNALFLSAAVQNKHPQLTHVFNWFRDIQIINMPVSHYINGSPYGWRTSFVSSRIVDLVDDMHKPTLFPDYDADRLSDRFRMMMQNADIGIVDMRVVKNDPSEEPSRSGRVRQRIQLKHRSSTSDAWLPLEEESQGTQKLFSLALPVLEAIYWGKVVIVDELEASLHPSLAKEIVNLFNDPVKNPLNAQLIFSTHDTNLLGTTMGEPVLRRDQVWLTEKDHEGGTTLYPLTDYQPRKNENLERGYLQGRYGAVPFLGQFAWNGEELKNGKTSRKKAKTS